VIDQISIEDIFGFKYEFSNLISLEIIGRSSDPTEPVNMKKIGKIITFKKSLVDWLTLIFEFIFLMKLIRNVT
jgi:hypothetical protein